MENKANSAGGGPRLGIGDWGFAAVGAWDVKRTQFCGDGQSAGTARPTGGPTRRRGPEMPNKPNCVGRAGPPGTPNEPNFTRFGPGMRVAMENKADSAGGGPRLGIGDCGLEIRGGGRVGCQTNPICVVLGPKMRVDVETKPIPVASEACRCHPGARGAGNVKRTQFAGGKKEPWTHGEHGDGCKWNWRKELEFMLCGAQACRRAERRWRGGGVRV